MTYAPDLHRSAGDPAEHFEGDLPDAALSPELPFPAAAMERLRARLHPQTGAGGFASIDGTVMFYVRVGALLRPDSVALDLGAGPGQERRTLSFRRSLTDLRGRCARVIGADPDPAVLTNPSLDDALVIPQQGPSAGRVPLADASVDLILSDHVFEYVQDPALFAEECARLLRPGGWLCARTPDRRGAAALAARLLPARAAPPRAEGLPRARAHHRLNSPAALRRAFPDQSWSHHTHAWSAAPPAPSGPRLRRALAALRRALAERTEPNLHVFLRRR